MIGKVFTFAMIIGWSIGSLVTSAPEFNFAFEDAKAELQKFETTKFSNWSLGVAFDYWVEGFGLAAIGFVAFGIFLYSIFPVPEIFVVPIAFFFIIDIILFGILSYFFIRVGFMLILLAIEKTGLINWGERFEVRRQD